MGNSLLWPVSAIRICYSITGIEKSKTRYPDSVRTFFAGRQNNSAFSVEEE